MKEICYCHGTDGVLIKFDSDGESFLPAFWYNVIDLESNSALAFVIQESARPRQNRHLT